MRTLFFRLWTVLALVLCVSGTWAQAQRHTSGQSIAALKKQATAGDSKAQFNLGRAYEIGQGVPQDYARAAVWYRKAAEQGEAGAQFNLGVFYDQGQGVPQDYAQAVFWYRKAAEQGDADAQANLGALYRSGQGVPQDYAQAVVLDRKAAEQGIAAAQNNLAQLLLNGWGVSQNTKEAMAWFQKAAEQGQPEAQYMLGQLYEDGGPMHTVSNTDGMSRAAPAVGDAAIPKDITLAAEWYRKAAEQENVFAQSALADLYEDGMGVPQSYAEAYFWYSLATAYAGSSYGGQVASSDSENRDRVAAYLTRTELTLVQERARKWFEEHAANAK